VTIYDKDGNAISISEPPDTRIFDNMKIRNAFLAGMELEGISFDGSDLSNSDLSGSDLYGAFLCDAHFDSCKLIDADLRSAFLFRATFRNSDLRGARLSLDELGGALSLNAVDLTDAILDGADFTGATYDSETIFPEGFDPIKHGLTPEE
jgi:uncharacterized protein YjbI with pentapeptide repeats